MPIYEFQCPTCKHVFDRLQKLSDPDPTTCPECGRSGVHRRVTAPAFRLAGSGWYETDFKGKGEARHNLATGDEAPRPAAADKAGADKPASDTPAADKSASDKSTASSSDG
ncbi:MAG: zinc ribbon domain-containing protein [Dokdonella sp.]|uniref:FmdB family zinc ribbon protein n=1 Tax=Dokdonella sp. TaxID=2291710 RepID=UPI0025C3CA16|nr:zinc ribbon domain-containing protein [Dokdonella sp.]MBX3700936.1 zinc ribbon domain-containing protein [Dokdonella sp.]